MTIRQTLGIRSPEGHGLCPQSGRKQTSETRTSQDPTGYRWGGRVPGTVGWELGCAVKERPGGKMGGPEVTVGRMLLKGFCGGWRFKAPEEVMLEVSLHTCGTQKM